MTSSIPFLLSAILSQANPCARDAYVERILLPLNTSQKFHGDVAIQPDGSLLAMTTRSCSDSDPCKDYVQGWLLNCRNELIGDVFPLLERRIVQPVLGGLIATGASGDHLVVWSPKTCVRAQAFSRDGKPLADHLVIAPEKCNDPSNRVRYETPRIDALRPRDEYVVAWAEVLINTDGVPRFRVRKYDRLGRWLDRELLIKQEDYPDLFPRDVASIARIENSERGIVELFTFHANRLGPMGVGMGTPILWRLTSDLELAGPPIVVTERVLGAGDFAVDGAGNSVAAWGDPGDAWVEGRDPVPEDQIIAQRYDRDGQRIGEVFSITGPPLRRLQINVLRLAMREDGQFTAVWGWEDAGLILGQRFKADGTKIGRRFQVNVTGPAYIPHVANNRQDDYVVFYMIGSASAGPEPHTVATRILNFNAPEFIRGDANNNDVLDLTDAIAILDYLFQGGAPPPVLKAADVNDDEAVNVSDPVYLLIHLFLGGKPPPHPYPIPGFDPTE